MTACVAAHGCITCGDEAAPMHVVKVDAERGLALCCDAAGAHSSVEIALVEPVAPGEVLLVHAGTALGHAAAPSALGHAAAPSALGRAAASPALGRAAALPPPGLPPPARIPPLPGISQGATRETPA
ncbi:MAG TPA: HypC/HybG/HupF family hydrogenase formation chaperone [Solirubrobacteraceae bacterium]|nr:HypC/HybG/HupF family hydrogenase formation chaperone [Solirubrobacteraceae bacterium]